MTLEDIYSQYNLTDYILNVSGPDIYGAGLQHLYCHWHFFVGVAWEGGIAAAVVDRVLGTDSSFCAE